MSLTLLRDRISTLWLERKTGPHFRWGVITSINPARVRFDGDTSPISGTPSSLVDAFVVGDRVYCLIDNRRVTIMGVGKGADGPRRFPSKAALDLWPAPDGTHAWVTADSREYVRSQGSWNEPGFQAHDFSSLLTVPGTLRVRRQGQVVEVYYESESGAVPAGSTDIATLPAGFQPNGGAARDGQTSVQGMTFTINYARNLTISNPGAARSWVRASVVYMT